MKKYFLLYLLFSLTSCFSNSQKAETINLGICAQNYEWLFQHQFPDNSTFGKFSNEKKIYLPANTEVFLELGSLDHIYIFEIPDLYLIEVALPDTLRGMRFNTGEPNTYQIKEGKMCGFTHESMEAELIIQRPWIYNFCLKYL